MRFDVGTLCITLLSASLCAGAVAVAQSTAPTLSVDVSSGRHAISHQVYGIASYGLDATYAKEIAVPNVRWGGDGTTRYNWQVDSSNAGFDWFFMGGSGATNPTPSGGPDGMVRTYAQANVLMTIPIIPYVNKSAAWSCSFPFLVYGAQQSYNPYVHPNGDNCGNSIAANGTQLIDNNIYANHIDNSPGFQTGWLQHLVGTFGTAANGGVAFYQLDNEPYGWGNTHRDVEPNGADYPTITQLGEQYAAAIKQADSSAMVLGPSDFTLGGWVGDSTKQNGLLAGQYYLQQMAAYEQKNGTRILDYFDEHYYFDVSSPAAQLASTRTLWDSTYNGGTWVEQWVFGGPMQLIPRFKGWVNQYYPGTKISLSEYSIDSGSKSIVDALAEMDVLGIFGREQLDFANMWSPPAPTDPIAYAFRMYRNYDGSGSQYGDMWVNATSSDQGQLSVYASQRSTDKVVTILVLNKTTATISTTLTLSGATLPPTAAVYTYTSANLQQIAQEAPAAISSGSITYSYPGYSATMFAFAPAPTPPASTMTALNASLTQATAGQSIVLTASVSGTGSPSGTVTFKDGGVSIGSAGLSSGTATLTTTTLAVGAHTITASYGGDTNDAVSNSANVTVTVTQAVPAATTTTLSASTTQVTSGQSVILTAAVSGTGSPTGTVTFKDGGISIGSAGLSGGTATLTTTLAVGSHTITASYSGDTNDAASNSSTETVIVTQPPPVSTTTTLSASTTQLTSGQSIILTAAVSSAGSPAGTVTFKDSGALIGSVGLSGGAAILTTTLAAGTHTITASYSGDTGDAASNSSTVTVTVTQPPPVSTTTSLSASASQITVGQSVVLTVAVSGTGSPTGNVTLNDNGTVAGSVPLVGGSASFTDANLTVGSHSIVAIYGGDANHTGSSSIAVNVVVIQAPAAPPVISSTTTSLTPSATQLTTTQSLVLTTTVKSSAGTPTGMVTFSDGTNTLGTVALSSGTASITSTLNAGSYTIVAAYGGDANDAPSSSAAVNVTVSNPAPPVTPAPPPAPQDFVLQLAQPVMTLAAGSSGQVGLTMTPENGFNQQVQLSCSGLPAGASCTFTPWAAGAAGAMTSSMTISVAPATVAASFLLPFSGVILLAGKRRRRKIAAMIALGFALFVAGCGSGGAPQVLATAAGAAPPSASASYMVLVTAVAAGGETHTQPMTLTVP